jgi:hypothetical protein
MLGRRQAEIAALNLSRSSEIDKAFRNNLNDEYRRQLFTAQSIQASTKSGR